MAMKFLKAPLMRITFTSLSGDVDLRPLTKWLLEEDIPYAGFSSHLTIETSRNEYEIRNKIREIWPGGEVIFRCQRKSNL